MSPAQYLMVLSLEDVAAFGIGVKGGTAESWSKMAG